MITLDHCPYIRIKYRNKDLYLEQTTQEALQHQLTIDHSRNRKNYWSLFSSFFCFWLCKLWRWKM